MDLFHCIKTRRSVRQFKPDAVAAADLEQILTAATRAPSGKNLQNWHFVVVKNKALIEKIALAVAAKNEELAATIADAEQRRLFRAQVPHHTFYREAPVVVVVFAGPYPLLADSFADQASARAAIDLSRRADPGIQNIGAAMENFLLAATALGYGTCWMTGPSYAGGEIARLVGFSQRDWSFAAMTPLGRPLKESGVRTPRKPLTDTVTIIE